MALRAARRTPRGSWATSRGWWHEPDIVIISLTFVVTMSIGLLLGAPSKTPPLTVVNDSTFGISLEVRAVGVRGWMELGTFASGESTVREVIDQGDRWLVRARVGPHSAAPFAVNRSLLTNGHWRLTIPEGVIGSLRRAGAAPEPWLSTPP